MTRFGGILPQLIVFIFDLGAGVSCCGSNIILWPFILISGVTGRVGWALWLLSKLHAEPGGWGAGGGGAPGTGGGAGGAIRQLPFIMGGGGGGGAPMPTLSGPFIFGGGIGGGGAGGGGTAILLCTDVDDDDGSSGGAGGGGGDEIGDSGPLCSCDEAEVESEAAFLRLGLVASPRQCGHENFCTLGERSSLTESSWLSRSVARCTNFSVVSQITSLIASLGSIRNKCCSMLRNGTSCGVSAT